MISDKRTCVIREATDLSHICTFLAYSSQELDARHPLLRAQSRFSGEIVHVRHQPLKYVLCPWVGTLRVDAVYILRDIIYREVLEDRNLDVWFRFGHCGTCAGKAVYDPRRDEASITVNCGLRKTRRYMKLCDGGLDANL